MPIKFSFDLLYIKRQIQLVRAYVHVWSVNVTFFLITLNMFYRWVGPDFFEGLIFGPVGLCPISRPFGLGLGVLFSKKPEPKPKPNLWAQAWPTSNVLKLEGYVTAVIHTACKNLVWPDWAKFHHAMRHFLEMIAQKSPSLFKLSRTLITFKVQ
jgi:hypothetical protein